MRSVLDRAMDMAIVPGFSRIGYAVRRGGWDADLPPMPGRTVVVTGATSGIGRAAAEGFARLGARVLVLARDGRRGEQAVRAIATATGNGAVELVVGDLASLASVRSAAAEIAARAPALDVLVNNASVMSAQRTTSADGIELTFATNVLGTFVLTELLIDALAAGSPSRIVTVSSGGMLGQRLTAEDLQSERGDYGGVAVYARSKRAQVVLTEQWAQRLAARGIVVHAMHPGWAATPGVADSMPGFQRLMGPLLRTPEQGADTILWLGAAPEPARSTGGFWHDRRARPTHYLGRHRESEDERRRLWESCVELGGLAA